MPDRTTPQLEAVYRAVQSVRDHPTAQVVFERVSSELPSISLSTVYRNLDKLSRSGRLRVLRGAGGVGLYDAVTSPHDHFVCDECGTVVDIDLVGAQRRLERQVLGHRVLRSSTMMYGVCSACDPSAERP